MAVFPFDFISFLWEVSSQLNNVPPLPFAWMFWHKGEEVSHKSKLACSRRSDSRVRREGRELEKANKEEKRERERRGNLTPTPPPSLLFFSAHFYLRSRHNLNAWNVLRVNWPLCVLLTWHIFNLFFCNLLAFINFSYLNSEYKTKTLQKVKKKTTKTYPNKFRCTLFRLQSQKTINIETFTMASAREKEKKIHITWHIFITLSHVIFPFHLDSVVT